MTSDEHRATHKVLHSVLDTLVACYVETEGMNKNRMGEPILTSTTLLKFMQWSERMVREAQATED